MKNSKQVFAGAILEALRLSSNEYTANAVELLIERLDAKEYSRFMAYLGERDSSYEKPIESIAKGVKEFMDLKELPVVEHAKKMAIDIQALFKKMKMYYSDSKMWNEFLEFDRTDSIFIELIIPNTKQKVFSDEVLDIMFTVGLRNISNELEKSFIDKEPEEDLKTLQMNICDSCVYQFLTKDLSKDVTKRIEIQAEKKQEFSLLELKNKAKMIGSKK